MVVAMVGRVPDPMTAGGALPEHPAREMATATVARRTRPVTMAGVGADADAR